MALGRLRRILPSGMRQKDEDRRVQVLERQLAERSSELGEARDEVESLRDLHVALQAQLTEALERIAELEGDGTGDGEENDGIVRDGLNNVGERGVDNMRASAQAAAAAATDAESEREEERQCCICLDPLREGDLVVRLPCMCIFHSGCVMEHLKSGTMRRCPIDRTEVAADIM